ncbi:MAG: hypothetical protein GY771_15530 [bacterium]|nr:hypothetical protein [bacterium]
MIRLLLIIHFALTVASFATGTVINSFTIPEMGGYPPRGLAYDASTDSYWVTSDFDANDVKAYRFTYDGVTAVVAETVNVDSNFFWSMDITVGDYLYMNSDFPPGHPAGEGAYFYHINKSNGNIVNSHQGPFGPDAHLNGAAYDGSYLYLSSYDDATVYEVTTDGTIVSSFSHDSTANNGLAWGGLTLADEGLWVVSGPPYNTVTKYQNGSPVEQWYIDLSDDYIGGACWGLDANESLLVSTFSGNKLIYEISFAPSGIKSASLGEIKAMFK